MRAITLRQSHLRQLKLYSKNKSQLMSWPLLHLQNLTHKQGDQDNDREWDSQQ